MLFFASTCLSGQYIMTKDTKRKSHSKLQPKITTGPSSMTNMLLAERASPWFSFESVPWQAHLRIRHRQP